MFTHFLNWELVLDEMRQIKPWRPQTSDKFDFSFTTALPPMSRGSLTWTLRLRASHPEWAEWSTASEVLRGKVSPKHNIWNKNSRQKVVFLTLFPLIWATGPQYWRRVVDTRNFKQSFQAAASNKRVQRIIQPRGENCDKQRCVFRGNDRTRTQNLLKFNWKFSQQWKAAIRSSYILRKRKKKS